MKRRRLDESSHPFDSHPFEAYWWGSWQPVERLRVKDGVVTMHVIDGGEVAEETIPISNLRLRSRKATVTDCSCILRQGVDVCILSTPDEKKKLPPVWADARIRSIERKPHDSGCSCKFYASFYDMEGPIVSQKRKINKDTSLVQIDQISILQKLDQKPCEDQHYRWCTSEDSSSLHQFKLFTGKFCTDLTWLLVASATKQTAFDVRSMQNRLVYEIYDDESDKNAAHSGNSSHFVNFKLDNGISSSVMIPFVPGTVVTEPDVQMLTAGPLCLYSDFSELRRSKRRNIKPERFFACDLTEDDIDMSRLGADKIFPRWESEEDDDDDDELPLALSVQDDHEYQRRKESGDTEHPFRRRSYQHLRLCGSESGPNGAEQSLNRGSDESRLAIVPLSLASEGNSFSREQDALEDEMLEDQPGYIGEMFSKYPKVNGSASGYRRKTTASNTMKGNGGWRGYFASKKFMQGGRIYRKHILPKKYIEGAGIFRRATHRRNKYNTRSEWESIYDLKTSGRKSLNAKACRDLIIRCMENIDASINQEQPEIIDQWKEFQSGKAPNQKDSDEKSSVIQEEEMSEVDMLWKEMELALASLYFLDGNEDSHMLPNERKMSSENGGNVCQHDYRLNEQIGIVCRLCGFVSTEIRDVSPELWSSTPSINKEQKDEEEPEHRPELHESLTKFHVPASSNKPSSEGEVEDNVWALIPELRTKLRIHQKKAFEFLWRNIAGSLVPGDMEAEKKNRGGCVISHTPGAGKTLLIITFLVSYLKLFPGSRPLVLAPKTTLYTWYKEIIKWKIPIPVYQIHGGQTYKGEVLRQRMRLSPGLPRNQDVMHVLDCLEKMQKWLSHPSVLLMGYTSFLTLSREGSPYAHRKYMAQVLKQCPGIVILDEGHNPRSTKSRLRKGLMKVDTDLRVLLSGTLFQNNFGEYFNTLCLARPSFVKEVLKELDPKYKTKKKNGAQTGFSIENRARKMFIDKISRRIDSNVPEERLEGLNMLKSLTSGFIDNYEGGSADNLPGLQCYTLMMKSTSLQHEILEKLQNQRPVYKGFPLELELLITLGAIHPWLIRTTQCSNQYFSAEELEDLERTKFDVKFGSKIRFVMSLIPKCVFRKEKVLIFCHNIAPINLFLDLFANIFRWRKGKEVLVLQGDIELFERGRVMDKFEEPGGPSKVMLASITACAEGISLTAASRVILLDSEWNPSKSKQAIARAFRPGQDKVVYVYQLLATGTLEEEKYSRTTWKEWVSSMIFSEELVEDPSHWQAPNIEDELLREIVEEDRATLFHRIMKIEKASSVIRGK